MLSKGSIAPEEEEEAAMLTRTGAFNEGMPRGEGAIELFTMRDRGSVLCCQEDRSVGR